MPTRVLLWSLLLLGLAGGAAPALADEAEDAPPSKSPAQNDTDLQTLRVIEGRLSVGEPLTDDERRELVRVLSSSKSARARAHAAAVLPWLGPDQATDPLMRALEDPDSAVRTQAALSLVALSRRVPADARPPLEAAARRALDDENDEVACAAARLLAALAPDRAGAELSSRAEYASDVRYGCWRRVAGLPMRTVDVPMPQAPVTDAPPSAADAPDDVEPPEAAAPSGPGTGDGVFVAAAAATGLVVGGVLPGAVLPPRDTLTYTRTRTTHAREEPSILLSIGSAIAGAGLLGGAALGLDLLIEPVGFVPATATAAMGGAGAGFGLGLSLALGLDEVYGSFTFASTTLVGFGVGTAMALVLPPSARDMTLLGSVTTLTTLYGVLTAFTVIPVGVPVLFNNVHRTDFSIGVGLMSGSVAALAALTASPLLDISHGRVLAATAASVFATSLGLTTTYFFYPTNFVLRPRVAAAVGVTLGLIAGPTVFVLLPDRWASVFDAERLPAANGVLAFDEGELSLGLPTVFVLDDRVGPEAEPGLGVQFFGGRF